MPNICQADKSVYEVVDHVVANNQAFAHSLGFIHEPCGSHLDSQILVVVREKASKSGGRLQLAKTRKAPPELFAATGTDYKFVIEIAGDEWLNLNDTQREALIFRQLCFCSVEEDPNSGDIKCSIRKPDVEYFYAELNKYGDWLPRPEEADKEGAVSGAEDPTVLEAMLNITPQNLNTGRASGLLN